MKTKLSIFAGLVLAGVLGLAVPPANAWWGNSYYDDYYYRPWGGGPWYGGYPGYGWGGYPGYGWGGYPGYGGWGGYPGYGGWGGGYGQGPSTIVVNPTPDNSRQQAPPAPRLPE